MKRKRIMPTLAMCRYALLALLLLALPVSLWADNQAYARLSTDGTSLTFYNDGNMADGDYSLNSDTSAPQWLTDSKAITTVIFDSSFSTARPTTCYQWFYYMDRLTSIKNISNLNTSDVTNMAEMFADCKSLESLDLSSLNTSAVTNMTNMFGGCEKLTELNLSGFNTSAVTTMIDMFSGCSNLKSLDLSSFNTSSVIEMAGMFYDCRSLTELDLSKFNTANARSIYGMFNECSNLKSLNLSSFNTENVDDMRNMFINCTSLTTLDLSNFNTAKVTDMSNMFRNCENLTTLKLSAFNTIKVTDMSEMFRNCTSLATLDLSAFRTTNVTDMSNMFRNCESLTTLDLSKFYNDKVENMSYMFAGCSSLAQLTLGSFGTDKVTNMSDMFDGCAALTSLDLSWFNTSNVTDMSYMFSACEKLTTLNLSKFNTAKVTDMSYMFANCSSLASIDLSKFNTTKVTNMSHMFFECTNLTTLNLSSFNTAQVENMENMFSFCTALTTIQVSNKFVTTSVTNSDYMFGDCTSLVGAVAYDDDNDNDASMANWTTGYLTLLERPYVRFADNIMTFYYGADYQVGDYGLEQGNKGSSWAQDAVVQTVTRVVIDPSFAQARPTLCNSWFYNMENLKSIEGMQYLNTSEVTEMMYMFANCSSLTSIDLSHFDTGNVTNFLAMFGDCSSLASLDLSSFNTSKVKNMEDMFLNSESLTTILVSNKFVTTSVTNSGYMFKGCTSLVGAVAYNENDADASMANWTMGYLTLNVGTNGNDVLGAVGNPLTIASLPIADDKAFSLSENCKAQQASYSRDMSNMWGTLCLPFSIDTEAEGNTCKFYTLQHVGTDCVTLSQIESGVIAAGTPVMICKQTDSQQSINIASATADVVTTPVNATAGDRLVGTFGTEILSDNGYFIANDKFYKVADYGDKGVKVSAYRAYLLADEAQHASMLRIGGATTGIDTTKVVDWLNDASAEYYDMSGRRIDSLQKGVNIIKVGNTTRKVIVK